MATKDTVEAYMSAWNEPDAARRAAIIEKCWSESATYTDPMSDVTGRDGLSALIAGFQQQMPGAGITFTSGIDEHHGRIRFGWKLTDAPTPMEGIDVGRIGSDGRLEMIIGFWGANPAAG